MTETARPILQYEAATLTRERLEDGTLRLTVVSHRGRFVRDYMLGLLLVATIAGLGYIFGPPRLQMRILIFSGWCLGLMVLFFLVLLMQPRSYTSVFEAGPFGIRVQTVVAGDPVRKSFARAEIRSIRTDGPLIIDDTRGNQHAYLPFETAERHRAIADALREAIG